ncbi:Rho GTPase activation protein [Mycena floridula]|nr:Rho GTPase activation protein [Mycena floridula]
MEAAQSREQHGSSVAGENSIPYIAKLTALELAIVKHSALLVLRRSPLRDKMDSGDLLKLIEVKSGFWNRLFNKKDKKKGVFGVPLEVLVDRDGSDSLLGASPMILRVPRLLDDLITAMRRLDISVNHGLFRKSGNIRRLRELTISIEHDLTSVDLTKERADALSNLLKKFLRELPEPLMTFKLYPLLLASQSASYEAEEQKRLLHMLVMLLPKSHRDTMEVLFVFLKWLASFARVDEETGSKFDLVAFATIISPSILYSRERDTSDNLAAIQVITVLLENQDELFRVPAEFLPILHDQEYFANSMELPAKDFLEKCDTYLQLKASTSQLSTVNPSTTQK